MIGLCAEYDALPGLGHVCGHNAVTAASTGAAVTPTEVAGRLWITIVLFGPPAEETGGGKVLMFDHGVFDGVAMAMRVRQAPRETCALPSLDLCDLEVRYTGKESRAAYEPERGVNAAGVLTVVQVAIGLARRHLDAGQMSHGIVPLGGAAPNIVPADTRVLNYLRAPDVESCSGSNPVSGIVSRPARSHLDASTSSSRYLRCMPNRGRTSGRWRLTGKRLCRSVASQRRRDRSGTAHSVVLIWATSPTCCQLSIRQLKSTAGKQ